MTARERAFEILRLLDKDEMPLNMRVALIEGAMNASASESVAAEREACAKACSELYAKWVTESLQLRFTDQEAAKAAAAKTFACHEIAAAIRARRNQPAAQDEERVNKL